jgi:hypothetical protein
MPYHSYSLKYALWRHGFLINERPANGLHQRFSSRRRESASAIRQTKPRPNCSRSGRRCRHNALQGVRRALIIRWHHRTPYLRSRPQQQQVLLPKQVHRCQRVQRVLHVLRRNGPRVDRHTDAYLPGEHHLHIDITMPTSRFSVISVMREFLWRRGLYVYPIAIDDAESSTRQ